MKRSFVCASSCIKYYVQPFIWLPWDARSRWYLCVYPFQIRCNSRLNRFCKFWAGGRVVRISPGYGSYVMRTLLRTPSGYSTFKFIPSTGCHMGLCAWPLFNQMPPPPPNKSQTPVHTHSYHLITLILHRSLLFFFLFFFLST